jgi:hypothetical protein
MPLLDTVFPREQGGSGDVTGMISIENVLGPDLSSP